MQRRVAVLIGRVRIAARLQKGLQRLDRADPGGDVNRRPAPTVGDVRARAFREQLPHLVRVGLRLARALSQQALVEGFGEGRRRRHGGESAGHGNQVENR